MYGLVVLLSLKLSTDLYPITGLAVVAQMRTCTFVTCCVSEYVHFVSYVSGCQQLIMTHWIYIIAVQPTRLQ